MSIFNHKRLYSLELIVAQAVKDIEKLVEDLRVHIANEHVTPPPFKPHRRD